jgi:hypothetical protein
MEPRTILSDYTYSYYSSKGYPTDILSDLDTKSGASTLNKFEPAGLGKLIEKQFSNSYPGTITANMVCARENWRHEI